MNRQITSVYDWNKKGIELSTFLKNKKYTDQLKNARVFYVVKPNSENVIKIGVSGENTGDGIKRFLEYQLLYGDGARTNNICLGMKVFYVGKTMYNPFVESKNSLIHKLELHMIRSFKKLKIVARGRERTIATLKKVKEIFDEYIGSGDIETNIRKSRRATAGVNKMYDAFVFV
tara:strand:- start:126 stop:647 length:522 start_codon:yes stop_codon:yes gene_type:complete